MEKSGPSIVVEAFFSGNKLELKLGRTPDCRKTSWIFAYLAPVVWQNSQFIAKKKTLCSTAN